MWKVFIPEELRAIRERQRQREAEAKARYRRQKMMVPFLPDKVLLSYATEALDLYTKELQKVGRELTFPLNTEDLVKRLFQLEVHYDDGSFFNDVLSDPDMLGCLYPDGCPCPLTGTDRVIVVNDSPRFKNVTTGFTILHEGVGHYAAQFLRGVRDEGDSFARKPAYCRTEDLTGAKVPRLEFQANRVAGEIYMPRDKVRWLLDGKDPGEVINLDIYGERLRDFFGASQALVEKRLVNLEYLVLNAKNEWADVLRRNGR